MSTQKRYTAQEMRKLADDFSADARAAAPEGIEVPNPDWVKEEETVSTMLRQAADAEDELKLALVTIGNQSDEIAKLNARLDAVVNECEKMRDDFSKRMRSFTGMFALNMRSIYEDKIAVVDTILRTARGESENK